MSSIENVNITTQGGVETDAFGKLRISFPNSILESKLMYDKQPLIWAEKLTGQGTSTYNANEASTTLQASTGAGAGAVIRQTKVCPNYQPARGQLVYITFILGQAAATSIGTFIGIGQYDDDGGIFLRQTVAGMAMVRRTNVTGTPVDNAVAQASWDDPMDGTGASGKTIDWTKGQILIIDYTWLGFGKIRFCFEIDGKVYLAHELTFSNALDKVWTSRPNGPVRFENDSAVNQDNETLDAVCCAVLSEGGQEAVGYHRSATPRIIAADEVQMPTAGTKYIQHAIRLKSTHLAATINMHDAFSFITSANSPFAWEIHLNPTVAGTAMSWANLTDSAVQSGTPGKATASTISVDGHIIASGYGKDNTSEKISLPETYNIIGADVDGVVDELYLCILSSGSNDDGLGIINHTELW